MNRCWRTFAKAKRRLHESRGAGLCIEDAKKIGITQAEIEEELYQNLYDELRDRMDARTTEEVGNSANRGG